MVMNVSLATDVDKEEWDDFVSRNEHGSFLQSWAWGETQKKLGNIFWRLVLKESGEIKGVALVIKRQLPLGQCWLYVPGGPVLKNPNGQIQRSNILGKVVGLAREEKAIFVKIDLAMPEPLAGEFDNGWKKSKREVQPRNTLVLDLDKSEEELLSDMHQKTRYNIRLAERRGVKIRFSKDKRDLEIFIGLAHEVSERTSFRYHPDDYYWAMREVLVPAGLMKIAVAEYQGQALAASLIITFGKVTTYAHGASSMKKKEVMASHLMQWRSILRAKEAGSRIYDFYGVAPQGVADHPWAGITRFKEGFGGRRVNYVGAYDFVTRSHLYALFDLATGVRKFLR